jgi:hypothetical protein
VAARSAARVAAAASELFHVPQNLCTWPLAPLGKSENRQKRGVFRNAHDSLLFRPFSLQPRPLKDAEMHRKRCGKSCSNDARKSCRNLCAKRVENTWKSLGNRENTPVQNPADFLSIAGGKPADNRRKCGLPPVDVNR